MHASVAWLYRTLGERGLIVGTSGNVSARVPGGMLVTPSGGAPDMLTELVTVSFDGVKLCGGGTPSSEWPMHAAVYQACPEAAFIVHTHADACTALACLHQGLPPFHYMVVAFGGDVRCAPYATFGSPALAKNAGEAIQGRSACLLANHGMIVCATTAASALSRAVLLETLCRQYLLALAAGRPQLLTEQDMQDARERFKTYGQPGQDNGTQGQDTGDP